MSKKLISTRKRGLVLMAIMMVIAIGVTVIANIILHRSILSQQKILMADLLHVQKGWIRNLSSQGQEQLKMEKERKLELLEKIRLAQTEFHGFGKTGEFVIVSREGDSLQFLAFSHREGSGTIKKRPISKMAGGPLLVSLSSSGIKNFPWDYLGNPVVAAYTQIPELEMGLVAKMDLEEIKEPFYRAGWLNAMVVFFVIALGLDLFRRVGRPMVLYQDEREEKYKNLFESSQLGIAVFGEKLEECNEKFSKIWDTPKEKLFGMEIEELFRQHPQGQSDWNSSIKQALEMAQHKKESKIILQLRGETEKYCEIYLKPIEYHQKKSLLAAVADISDRIKAQANQTKLEAQLRQAQKMEATGRLAGGIAHDYNNILATITLNADFLEEGLRNNSNALEEIGFIKEAASRGKKLTQQLLTFSRRKPVTLEILELNTLVSDLLKMVHRLIEENIALNMKLNSKPCFIYADKLSIEQVIMNLVINSKDAISSRGEITIETNMVKLTQNDIQNASQEKPGVYVVLAISDTGQGMSAEVLNQIFEPFFTTKDIGKGTGLGLSTVYGIIQQIEGFIRVQSEAGKGTRFEIFMPEKKGETIHWNTKESSPIKLNTSKAILLIEDDLDVCHSLAKGLINFGFKVFVATTYQEAKTQFESNESEIGLILADVIIPGSSGPDIVKSLLSPSSPVKVLYFSGHSEIVYSKYKNRMNSQNFISKPFSSRQLAQKLQLIL